MTDGVDSTAREGLAEVKVNMVRRDVYKAEQDGLKSRVAECEKDIIALEAKVDKQEERAAAGRRLLLASFILPLLLALILLYVQSQIGAK